MDIIEQLERDEGLRLKPYRDTVGKLTIGIGRNLDDKGISREEARILLENDLEDVIDGLVEAIPWYLNLSEPRRFVLVNMAFNLGVTGLLGFKMFLMHLRYGDIEKAAAEMLDSDWSRQVGQRAVRLAEQMMRNEWI